MKAVAPLGEVARAAVRSTLEQLRARPTLWGPVALGYLLCQHLPKPAFTYVDEVRAALGVSGPGSLAVWSAARTVEQAVDELMRLLEAPCG